MSACWKLRSSVVVTASYEVKMNRFLSDGPLLSERRHGLIRAMFGLGDLLDSIMSELVSLRI